MVQPAGDEAAGRMGQSRSIKIILPLKNNQLRGLQVEAQEVEEDCCVLPGAGDRTPKA